MPQTKIKSKNGKVYTYEYKYQPIWIRPEIHERIKMLAMLHEIPMNTLLDRMVNDEMMKMEDSR